MEYSSRMYAYQRFTRSLTVSSNPASATFSPIICEKLSCALW